MSEEMGKSRESATKTLESTSADLLARWEMGLIKDRNSFDLLKHACECVHEHMPVDDDHILDAYSMLVGGTLTAVGIHLKQIEIDSDAPEG